MHSLAEIVDPELMLEEAKVLAVQVEVVSVSSK